jgi:hypothetical protein
MTSTVPRALRQCLSQALRGLPSAIVTATALTLGVVGTGLGFTIGQVRTPRTATRERARLVARPPYRAIAGAGLPVAIALWIVSLPRIRLERMGDYGLVPLLPVTFWAALAVLMVAYAVLVQRGSTQGWVLTAHLIALIAFLHATPSVLYDTLRYAWAWKYVGVVDYFLRHNEINSSIKELGVNQHWPGFFTFNATLVNAAGLQTARDYAPWAPPFFTILLLGPLYLIFSTFSSDRRLVWTGLAIYVLGAWVGQEYFAPQPMVYFLYLTVIALCLRYRAPQRRGAPPEPHGNRLVGAALIVMVAAIAPTHQLTPVMVIFGLGVLVLCRYRVKTLLLAAIVMAVAWDALIAWPWIAENLDFLSLGSAGDNATSGFTNLSTASHSQGVVAQIDRAFSATIGGMAIVGFVRRGRYGRAPALALLAVAPLSLLLTSDYGGEMVFRVYLFALPFVSFFAAAALFPHAGAGRSWRMRLVLPAALLVLIPGFLFSHFGKEQANYFSRGETDASLFLYGVAPRGSLIASVSRGLPWGFMNYEIYDYLRFGTLEAKDRQRVLTDPVGSLADMMVGHHHAYLIISRQQIAEVEMTGAMPNGSVARVEEALLRSPRFTVIFRNPDAVVLTLTQPVPEEAP